MERIDACKNSTTEPAQPAIEREDGSHDSDRKGCNAEVETKQKPVKRASKRLQSKVQSKQASYCGLHVSITKYILYVLVQTCISN